MADSRNPRRFVRPIRWTLLFILAAVALPEPTRAHSVPPDSSERSILVLPNVFYTPETKIAGGLVLGYFAPLDAASPTSSVQLAAIYTQRRQFFVQVVPELYWHRGQWRLDGYAMVSRYPDVFYGIGPSTSAEQEEEFASRLATLQVALQRTVRPGWRLGPELVVHHETVIEVADDGILAEGGVPGRTGGTAVGLGVASLWDGRDNLYFPRRGRYLALRGVVHHGALGSDFNFIRGVADARQYVPVGAGHVLALNGYVEAVSGTAPFQLLPLLGGDDLMRGYREGRFRDDLFAALQAGYRFPLPGRLGRLPLLERVKGAVFANAGNVADRFDAFSLRGAKYAVGAGVRLRLNDEGLHGRVDYAIGPEGSALYVTLLEAF